MVRIHVCQPKYNYKGKEQEMSAITEFRRFTLNMNGNVVSEGVTFSNGAGAIVTNPTQEIYNKPAQGYTADQLNEYLKEWDKYKGNEIVWLDQKAVLGF